MTSHEIASADSLLAELAELRRALRIAMDENEQRIEIERRLIEEKEHVRRQLESLQKWVARGMAPQPPPIILEGVGTQLLAELEAARAFIATARLLGIDWDAKPEERERWLRDLHAYKEAAKARNE